MRLIWCSEEVKKYSEALAFEKQVKGWSRAKKESLIRGDFGEIHEIVKNERKEERKSKRDLRTERSETAVWSNEDEVQVF